MAKEQFYVIRNPTTGKISEDTSKKEKPKRGENLSSSAECQSDRRGWVLTVILLVVLSFILLVVMATKFSGVKHEQKRLDKEAMKCRSEVKAFNLNIAKNQKQVAHQLEEMEANRSVLFQEMEKLQNDSSSNLAEFQSVLKSVPSELWRDVLNEIKDACTRTENASGYTCQPCSAGWHHSGSCYYFSKQTKNWMESKDECERKASHLIIIKDQDQLDFVFGQMKGNNFWIGLSDKDIEGNWIWVDGSNVTIPFWSSGEPNNANTNEDCVEVLPNQATWNDISCDQLKHFVCEKKAVAFFI
ncbi:low affinity immunoglobulin epsilon Fc receptor-like isoform X1 [Acipenser ruthenus]|uniref:low affinity immunoglobulin epsilon Fc receptor-like isoform X1 n=1 Tax=Acipenser ruthenus TaxID=7906 RepID=UPI00274060B6|nr:low affinity immunoglobulin epsilon Fc receptor-like isoform X1 [Acipenser ruthenus]